MSMVFFVSFLGKTIILTLLVAPTFAVLARTFFVVGWCLIFRARWTAPGVIGILNTLPPGLQIVIPQAPFPIRWADPVAPPMAKTGGNVPGSPWKRI